MKYIEAVVVVMILLVPSVVLYSPKAEIVRNEELDIVVGGRSGPQTFQDEMGGWWMQDEAEDFEGGEFEDTEIKDDSIGMSHGPIEESEWFWLRKWPNNDLNSRSHPAVGYDELNNRIIVFGGQESGGDYLQDTWEFSLDTLTWNQIATTGPSARRSAKMVYDSKNQQMILFGGFKVPYVYFGDTWFFDLTMDTWSSASNSGPEERIYHSMTYEDNSGNVILFGGMKQEDQHSPEECFGDTWSFNPQTKSWDMISSTGPRKRCFTGIAYSGRDNKILLFGGQNYEPQYCKLGDTWSLDLTTNTWTELHSSAPRYSVGHEIEYDPTTDKFICIGGDHSEGDAHTYIFDFPSNSWRPRDIQSMDRLENPCLGYNNKTKKMIAFKGRIDFNTYVLTNTQIVANGHYTSPSIQLPSDYKWHNLTIGVEEEKNTKLTVSIINSETGLYIPEYRDIEPRSISLSGLSCKAIRLRCHFEGDRRVTPTLDSWKVTWKKSIPKPEYLGGIPSNIPVTEDTPEPAILDLSEYFGETRSGDFTYGFESISDDKNVHLEINDSYLDVTYLEDNWTGRIDLVVNCTNDHGESVSSDKFSIVVQRVDDAPAWTSEPPPISIDEDGSYASDFSYTDYLTDAENDLLAISAVCDVSNVTVQMSPEGYLTVIPEEDYYGTGTITITASEIYNPALKCVETILLTINEVNDDPTIKLLSPGDGAIYNETKIALSWEAEDVDTLVENITFNLYFGESKSPVLHTSDMTESSFELNGLSDKTTYYWYVMANDGDGGEAASPARSFNIDTESEVIPGDTGSDVGNLNVTIEVDVTKIVVVQGEETTFNLEIKNDGEKTVTLTIVTSGDAAPCLSLNNFITLAPSESRTEIVKVTRTAFMNTGNYTISLVFVSPDGMKYISIPLWIKENMSAVDGPEDDDDDEKKGDSGETKVIEKGGENTWLFMVVVFVFLVIILLAVLSMIRNSKLRSRMSELERIVEKDEVLEGEAYLPEKKSFQSEIEDRTAIPVSPGPYQPPELPGKPFDTRVAAFQPQQVASPQLPASQPTTAPESSSVSTEPMPDLDLSGVPGITPTPLSTEIPAQPVPESLQTPIDPFVQLPQASGTSTQEEQKMLPENATPPSPPPSA